MNCLSRVHVTFKYQISKITVAVTAKHKIGGLRFLFSANDVRKKTFYCLYLNFFKII